MFSHSLSVPQSLSPESFGFGNSSSHHHHMFNRTSWDCLQQLAALFVQLNVFARGSDFLQAAVAISHVREGVDAWKRFVNSNFSCTSLTVAPVVFDCTCRFQHNLHDRNMHFLCMRSSSSASSPKLELKY